MDCVCSKCKNAMIFKHQAYTDFVKLIKNFLCEDEYTLETYTIRYFFLSRILALFYIKLSFYELSEFKTSRLFRNIK